MALMLALFLYIPPGYSDMPHVIYPATYVKNYDGDSVTLNIHIYLNLVMTTRVRINGFDTPEIEGDCQEEIDAAVAARDHLKTILEQVPFVLIRVLRFGRWNRPVVDMDAGGIDIAYEMIRSNHAVPYDGKSRRIDWCKRLKEK